MTDLKELSDRIQQFAIERDWVKYHNPKNLIMALAGEAGELLELFQWLSPEQSADLTDKQKSEASHEIADVGIYLMRLCQVLNIDLLNAISSKIAINEMKYPVEKTKGSAKKYTDYV